MRKILILFFIGISYLNAQKTSTPFFPVFDKSTKSWYFLDKNGNKSIRVQEKNISEVHPIFSNRALAKDSVKNKWGYLDINGTWAIMPIYDTGEDFVDNYTVVSNLCTKDCNSGDRGLMSDYVAMAIDTKGKVYFTDNSQDPEPFSRRMLYKHIGNGVFIYNSGIGMADLKYYCDIKGNVISDRLNLYDASDAHSYYSKELNAYYCKNSYINSSGKEVIDLSKYSFVSNFINGYCWAETYEEESGEMIAKYLLDENFNEIIKSSTEEYSMASIIVDGKFTYEDYEGNLKQYDIVTKTTINAPEKKEWQKALEEYDYVCFPNEDIILLVEYNNYSYKYIGFINKNKQVFLSENY